MKYTPGPWVIDEDRMAYIENALDGEWQAIGLNDEEGFAEIIAFSHPLNANLIAAAPELLEVVKYCRGFLNVRDHDTKYIDGVIAKAEGKK